VVETSREHGHSFAVLGAPSYLGSKRHVSGWHNDERGRTHQKDSAHIMGAVPHSILWVRSGCRWGDVAVSWALSLVQSPHWFVQGAAGVMWWRQASKSHAALNPAD
jgi:hypothetical protein